MSCALCRDCHSPCPYGGPFTGVRPFAPIDVPAHRARVYGTCSEWPCPCQVWVARVPNAKPPPALRQDRSQDIKLTCPNWSAEKDELRAPPGGC